MEYTPRKTVCRLAREQLHLNKAKLWRSKFPYLDQWESCLVYQPFVSSCRFYGLRATGQNILYSGVNCALGPSKSIRYSGVCFHVFYCNSAGPLSNVVRYHGVSVIEGFVIAGCHVYSQAYSHKELERWRFLSFVIPPVCLWHVKSSKLFSVTLIDWSLSSLTRTGTKAAGTVMIFA